MCNVEQGKCFATLTRPSNEEIATITVAMVAQVKSNYQLRNRVVGEDQGKPSGLFVK